MKNALWIGLHYLYVYCTWRTYSLSPIQYTVAARALQYMAIKMH